jgi:manganese/zinc/iron transport system ATP- binding protein
MIIQVENPILEVHDLAVSYHQKPVLWGIDFTIPKGKLVGIIGPNGAGKSTLIKAIMGLIPISSGYIQLFKKNLNEVRHKVGYVPQRESVDWDFPISVLEVVLMGMYHQLGLFQKPQTIHKELAISYLEKVGMESFSKRQISELSGGQQQRVFLARSLAQAADLYFMDEPFAGVDIATETAIIQLLKEMREAGKTIIVVHHDLQSVAEYFDWVIMLNMRLVASAPTQQVLTAEILQETYGGKLTILSKMGDIMKSENFPLREK